LELEFDHRLPVKPLKGLRLRYQYWLQDSAIRHNLTASCWLDVSDPVESNKATVLNPSGAGIPNAEFQRILSELPDEGPEACAIRWAVVAGGYPRQAPAPIAASDAASLNRRPLTKG
jgi:hypothetical protein